MKFCQERLCHSDLDLKDFEVIIWSFLPVYTFDPIVQKYCLPASLTEVN